jgi:uncharacterized protein
VERGIIMRKAHFPGRAPIDAYGNGGFRFAEMSHRGSILCLPSGIHGWAAGSVGDLVVSDFDLILSQKDQIEILLLGTGPDMAALPKGLRRELSEQGLSLEPMSTGAAVRTFNVLLAEDRLVAAALIAVD